MYLHNDWEDVIYEEEHIEKVKKAIKKNFELYFNHFIESEGGNVISQKNMKKLAEQFGCQFGNGKHIDKSSFKVIIRGCIDDFENDGTDKREDYQNLLDAEGLEEEADDPDYFKRNTLKNKCPVIRTTLRNKRAKELDKFRAKFNMASPQSLLNAVTNICNFKDEYLGSYDANKYEEIEDVDELGLSELDEEDYAVTGVIGGGIRSHLLYKCNPSVFPNMGRVAIWAMWYLTDKEKFGCTQDSEFLMIDIEKNITQHNYFYPYGLYSYYAFNIYKLLQEKAEDMDAYIDPDYKYVIVDAFMHFIFSEHEEEIAVLRHDIKEEYNGYF